MMEIKPPSNAGTKIRGMGCHEGYQVAMHALDQYRGTIVAGSYIMPSNSDLPRDAAIVKSTFHDAITRIVLAQSHLHVGIKDENTANPFFVCIDRLDLREHVIWKLYVDPHEFETLYREYVETQLDSRYENLATRPGWKVVVLHQAGSMSLELLYVWNHPHHDGVSGKLFHQQLLRNLNETFLSGRDTLPESLFIDSADRCILKIPDPTSKLPPNPEILSWWPMTPRFFVKALWKAIKPQSIFSPDATHAHWAPIQTSPFATQFRNFTIDIDTVTRVIAACRQHDTTLTGLVQTLVLVSLTSALEHSKGFAARTPYDLRHILPSNPSTFPWLVPKESMCNYASVVEHEFTSDLVAQIRSTRLSQARDTVLPADLQDIIWTVAARVRQEIQARLDAGFWNDLIGIMKLCSNWFTQQQSEVQKVRYLSWLVSNLGVLDGRMGLVEGQEGWTLTRAELLLSAEVPSAAFTVSMMTIKDRQLVVTCSWQGCVVEAGLGERLTGDLERWLMQIGRA